MANATEFLTSNLHIAYPFRENASGLTQADAVHGAAAQLPANVFVDAHFSVRYNAGALYLSQVQDLGGGSYACVFVNQYAAIMATATFSISGWPTVPFYETVTVSDPTNGVYGKFVLYGPAALAYLAGIVTADSFGFRLPFEHSVVVNRNRSVETFEIYTALPPTPAPDTPGPISGDVQIMSGYNVDTTLEVDDTLDVASITLAAPPGNAAPCEHSELLPFFKGLMQLEPDANGNIQVEAGDEGCYSILPIPNPSPGPGDPQYYFQIQGNCKACCSCDDYKNVATALQKLLQRSKDVLATLSDAHNGTPNGYTAGVTYYNSVIAPLYTLPTIAISGARGVAEAQDPLVKSGSAHLLSMCTALKNNSKWKWMFIYAIKWEFTAPAAGYIRQMSVNGADWATWPASNWLDLTSTAYDQFQQFFPPADFWAFYSLGIRRGKTLNIHMRLQGVYPDSPAWAGTVTAQLMLWDGVATWDTMTISRDFDFSQTDPMVPV